MDDQDNIAQIRRVLGFAPYLRQRSDALLTTEPDPNSAAATDRDLPFGACATIYASQALQVSVDHLFGWHALVEAGILLPFTGMTLLRSILEGGVRSRWHSDLTEDPRERGRRGALAMFEDLTEKRRFGDSLIPTGTPDELAEQAVFKKRATRRAGAAARLIRSHGWAANAGNPPSINISDLAPKYGVEQWLWRLASGYAHGREWAITSGDHIVVARRRAGWPQMIKTQASGPTTRRLARVAVALVGDAIRDIERYRGLVLTSPEKP